MQKLLFIGVLFTLLACNSTNKHALEDWKECEWIATLTAIEQEQINEGEMYIRHNYDSLYDTHRHIYRIFLAFRQLRLHIQEQFHQAEYYLVNNKTLTNELLSDKTIGEKWINEGYCQALVDSIQTNLATARDTIEQLINYNFSFFGEDILDEEKAALEKAYNNVCMQKADTLGIQDAGYKFRVATFEDKALGSILFRLAAWEYGITHFYNEIQNHIKLVITRNRHNFQPYAQITVSGAKYIDNTYSLGEKATVEIHLEDAYWEYQYDSIRYLLDNQEIYKSRLDWEDIGAQPIRVKLPKTEKGTHQSVLTIEAYHPVTAWEDEGSQFITYQIQ